MSSQNRKCHGQDVTACLVDPLPDDQREALELHLADCDQCRAELENHAATVETWDSARLFLRDDENDRQTFADQPDVACDFSYQAIRDALSPTDDPRMLGRLGPYEISGIIGSGGMGIVLKAFDPSLSRFVAMKVLAPALWSDVAARERFSRESRAAASIVHENVIEIYGVAEHNGIPYFTMPYLRGDTLQQRMELCGAFSVEEVLRISKQLADALAAAHAQGLIHRDIKPSNVLLADGSERVRLGDFGLAHFETDDRLTYTGAISGTPRYMSPEQVQSDKLDQRSDLFSLGTVIYEMCAARSPFEADSVIKQLMLISESKPDRLEVASPSTPLWLAAIVNRLHSPSPEDRYESAKALATDLEQCLANVQNPDACSQPRSVVKLQNRYVKAKRREKNGPRVRAAIGFLGVILVGLLWMAGYVGIPMMMANAGNTVSVAGRVIDERGQPVADTVVLAIQKTWPQGRFHQQSLQTKTDKYGKFEFDKFSVRGQQYAFLLTALPKNHTMTSVYQMVENGAQQRPVDLKVVSAKPTSFQLKGSDGQPLSGAVVLPTGRDTASGKSYMAYAQHVAKAGTRLDQEGNAQFSSFMTGDAATFGIRYQGEFYERKVKIRGSRKVVLSLPVGAASSEPNGEVVDSAGKPLANAKILVIHKSWPGGRYQQRAESTKTDTQGNFRYPKPVSNEMRNALLVTVLANGHEMMSNYKIYEVGAEIKPLAFKLTPVETVSLQFVDDSGAPLVNSVFSISSRHADGEEHLIYSQSQGEARWRTDSEGKAKMGVLAAGDKVEFAIAVDGEIKQVEANITDAPNQKIVVKKKVGK